MLRTRHSFTISAFLFSSFYFIFFPILFSRYVCSFSQHFAFDFIVMSSYLHSTVYTLCIKWWFRLVLFSYIPVNSAKAINLYKKKTSTTTTTASDNTRKNLYKNKIAYEDELHAMRVCVGVCRFEICVDIWVFKINICEQKKNNNVL